MTDAREGEGVWGEGWCCGDDMLSSSQCVGTGFVGDAAEKGWSAQNAARVAVPATTYQVTSMPLIRSPGGPIRCAAR
jgi:hypothetical protein